MRAVIPVIIGILILGGFSYSQDAFAVTITLSDQASCEGLPTFDNTIWTDNTCTVEGNIWVQSGNELVIPNGVTLNQVQHPIVGQVVIINEGSIINNGIMTMTLDAPTSGIGLAEFDNRVGGEFVNNGKLFVLIDDYTPTIAALFNFRNVGTLTNNGEIEIETRIKLFNHLVSFDSSGDFVNNGKLSLITLADTESEITFSISGNFSNDGIIVVNSGSTLFTEVSIGGSFTNTGVIDLDNQIMGKGLKLINSGTFNNGGLIELDNQNPTGDNTFQTKSTGVLTNFCLGEINLGQNSVNEILVIVEAGSFDNAGTYTGTADPNIQDISFACTGVLDFVSEQENIIDTLTAENISLLATIDELLANALATFSTAFVQPILAAVNLIPDIADDASLTRTLERSLSTLERADGVACNGAESFEADVDALLADGTINQDEADTLLERSGELLATCTP